MARKANKNNSREFPVIDFSFPTIELTFKARYTLRTEEDVQLIRSMAEQTVIDLQENCTLPSCFHSSVSYKLLPPFKVKE